MSSETPSNSDANQPQIQDQHVRPSVQQTTSNQSNKNHGQNQQGNVQNKDDQGKRVNLMMQNIRVKHPDCIPVFYVKHQASPKDFPSPKIPFILFKKDLLIEQAMYNLYNQIQTKGLYFFCTRYDQKDKRMKYVLLKPGQTIEQIYKRYGKNDHLTLIYGDKNIGMGGVNKLEKWLIRIMVFLLAIWFLIIAYPMYIAYEEGGVSAVWDTLSLIWKRSTSSSIEQKADSQEINGQNSIGNGDVQINQEALNEQDLQLSSQIKIPQKQEMWKSSLDNIEATNEVQL